MQPFDTQNGFAPEHTVPQAPQLFGSTEVILQLPLHSVSLDGHVHWPAEHVDPPPHTLPQLPQFVLLVWKSTHVPLHEVWPNPQQVPRSQCWPLAHALLHTPQLLGSLATLTHVLLHVSGVVDGQAPQTPAVQAAPVVQAVQLAPQWVASVLVLVQVPSRHRLFGDTQVEAHVPLLQT